MSDEKTQNPIFAIILLIGLSLGLVPLSLSTFRSATETKPTVVDSQKRSAFPFDLLAPIKQDLGCDCLSGRKCPSTQIKFVIALVADPASDGQSATYDETLSTLERAAADSGHTFVGHSLPHWNDDEPSLDGKPRPSFMRPGSLVFRRNETSLLKYQYLVILLVLESPIRGISIDAFRSAVRTMRHSKDNLWSCPYQKIRVIGPTYSGTKETLTCAINASYDDFKKEAWPGVQVVTGSATAMEKLQTGGKQNLKWFRTVRTVNESLYSAAITGYLHTDRGNLTILAESETAFGKVASTTPQINPNNDQNAETQPRVIVFPRQIAAVRSAYLRRLGSEEVDRSPLRSDRHLTRLDLTSDHPSPDIPRAASLKTSPVINELVLRRLMDDLSTTWTPYIAIIATDPRDTVFLAELVKRSLPNTQLILIEPHLMYARPEVAGYLRGAIVASTYPLTSITQRWTSPGSALAPIQFVSDSQQGTFNAALAQFGSTRLRDYRPPTSDSELSQPPVWISMIGRDGFWPITTISGEASNSNADEGSPRLLCGGSLDDQLEWSILDTNEKSQDSKVIHDIPLVPRSIMPLGIVFTVLSCLAICSTLIDKRNEKWSLRFWQIADFKLFHADRLHQAWLVLSLVGISLLLLFYSLPYFSDPSPSKSWPAFFACSYAIASTVTTIMVAFLAVMYLLVAIIDPHSNSPKLRKPTAVIVVLGIALMAISSYWLPSLHGYLPSRVFTSRDVSLLNGVSLLTPTILLLLFVAIRSFTSLKIKEDRCAASEKSSSSRDLTSVRVGLVIATCLVGLTMTRWPLPWNSGPYVLFIPLFLFALAYAWEATVRVHRRWKVARGHLDSLALMPFLPALDRLPQQFTTRLGMYLSAGRADQWLDEYFCRHVAQLKSSYDKLNKHDKNAIAELVEKMGTIQSSEKLEPSASLKAKWGKREPASALRATPADKLEKLDNLRTKGGPTERFQYLADDLFALVVIKTLNHRARRLRFSLAELLYSLMILLLVVCSFPLPGQPYWVALFVMWLVGLSLYFIWIILHCDRDEVLSRIANTQPNRLSWSAEMLKSLAIVLIPAGVAVTTVFPEVYESLVVIFTPLWSMFVRN